MRKHSAILLDCTPFLLMYGREACLPIDLTRVQPDDEPQELDFELKLQRMLELQKKLHEQAYANIQKAQACQKKQYEAKHNTDTRITVGDKVLVKSMKNESRKGEKLELQFTGPYTVPEDIRKG